MAKMKIPEGGAPSVTVGDKEYLADKKGMVNVPDQYIDVLRSHNFELVGPSDTEVDQAQAEKDAQIVALKLQIEELDKASDDAMKLQTTAPSDENQAAETAAIEAYNKAVDELKALEG